MQLVCSHCSRDLEYYGERPLFCAYCGRRLGDAGMAATQTFDSDSPAGPPAAPDAPRDPERIGGYRLVRLVGRGGMGSVYEAEDLESGRRVALKLLAGDSVASPEAVERFRREGRLASTIAHPRCVFVLAADEEEGRPYIVMELTPGETLQSLVERSGPLPPREATGKILDVIEGLTEAHQVGIIHRDVKPSNCFLEADGRVKIGDFGLSKSLGGNAQLTRTGAFLGTPLYASPEQIRCDPIDARTDVYSTAATLYFLLTGRPPFQESDAAATLARIVSEPAPSMRGSRRDVPAALDVAVLRGLERDRQRRWRDLAEFRAALVPFGPRIHSSTGLGLRRVLDSLPALGSIRWRISVGGRRRAPRGRRMPRPRAVSIAQPVGVLRAIGPFQVRGAVRWGRAQGLARSGVDARSTGVDPLAAPGLIAPFARPPRARPLRPTAMAEGGRPGRGAVGCLFRPARLLARRAGRVGRPAMARRAAAPARPRRGTGSGLRRWDSPRGAHPRRGLDPARRQHQLVDVLVPSPATATDQAPQRTDQERALDLLFQAAALALEGGRRPRHDDRAQIRAAIPEHIARSLDRLNGLGPHYADVGTFLDVLRADDDRPTEVTASRRVAHFGVQAIAVAPGLTTMFLAARPSRIGSSFDLPIVLAWPLIWVVWATLTRGGWLLGRFGIVPARFDSRPAERWRCGLRAGLAWAPATMFLLTAAVIRDGPAGPAWLAWLNWVAALLVVVAAVPLALSSPARLPHDRVAGIWLVPR